MPTVVNMYSHGGIPEGFDAGFLFTRSDASGTLTVHYTIGGTATPGTDFGTSATSGTVTFNPGENGKNLYIPTYRDSISEPTETIVVSITPDAAYTTGAASGTFYLYNNTAQQVTLTNVADATEGGANGTFRFTRTGDTSSALTANYTVGGTATSGTDYTALSGTVTFAAGYDTADVAVAAATDTIYDPDETVVVTVASGTGYTVGTGASDTVTIANDDETVETLIHQQTFQLAGSSGNVNVTLTVTYNAPGAPGLYTWVYEVTNPSENAAPLTAFEVPVDEMDSDVTNLASSLGWTGTAGVAGVSWAADTGLAPGATATFSFTTLPREVGDGSVEAGGTGGFFADLPTAPAPRQKTNGAPRAEINFLNSGTETRQYYTISVDITTASGDSFTTGSIAFSSATAHDARDSLIEELTLAGWRVRPIGENSLVIVARQPGGGVFDGLKSVKLKITATGVYAQPPTIESRGGLSVTRELP